MAHLLDYLADRVLLCDRAMGTQVQARNLDIERDFWSHENCTEILNESRPDLIREIHRLYLTAGCDALQTNSFGGSPITDRKSTRLNSSHEWISRMPSSA